MAINNKKKILNKALSLFFVIIFALSFRSFIAEPFRIPSGSMKSGLLIGDYIVVLKFKYGYSNHSLPFSIPLINKKIMYNNKPKRGDVVVFRPPHKTKLHYIKRVIGIPGDRVQIINGDIYINEKKVNKQQIEDWHDNDTKENYNQFMENISNKEYLIILDKNKEKHINKYTNNTHIFTVPEKHFFLIGDNRNHSIDSRFNEVGFIPEENIVGKASLIVFSFNAKNNKFFLNPNRFIKKII